MPFVGAIPLPVQQILDEHVQAWPCRDVYVGCSGNFTVERVLASHGRFALHSNDVSIYTSALGAVFSGRPFRLALNPGYDETFGWLRNYLTTPIDAAATIMLSTRLAESLDNEGQPRHNDYYQRLYAGFKAQWETLHARTVGKIQAVRLALADYACEDVFTWIDRVPEDAGFVSYPPFYDTASGGYNRLYHRLNLLFDWDRPTFQSIDDARLTAFLDKATTRPYWLLGVKEPNERLAPYLRGIVKVSAMNIPIYVYASTGAVRVVGYAQATEPVYAPRLLPGQVLGDRLSLALLTAGQFNALRSQYLNAAIKPVPASQPFAVLVDGLVIGAFAFSTAPNVAQYQDLSCIYLLSDFAVAPTDYPKLSKLVLYAMLSREGQRLAERAASRRIRRVTTTAFTNKPVSMKYRGLLDLDSRKETDPAKHPGHAFQLQYTGEIGRWTLAEGLALWKKKHGERTDGHPDHQD